MKFINYIRWIFLRKRIEEDLQKYIALEYRRDDVHSAFQRIYEEHKQAVLNA